MTDRSLLDMLEARTQEMYASVPDDVKAHVKKAHAWAKDYMMRKEGAGHSFYLSHEKVYSKYERSPTGRAVLVDTGRIICSFAKPEWSADHSSRGMPTGAEAIVMAVCEYVSGY